MASGDIAAKGEGAFGIAGSRPQQVILGTTASINPGEPVAKVLGSQYVTTMATAKPVVGTDFLAGISMSTSTETATADGVVYVTPLVSGVVYYCTPTTPANWDTQAEYTARVGRRVVMTKASGIYTVDDTDGATNGLVVENLTIAEKPGKVAFSLRAALSYTA